jgi:pimeloyl-ACP methyl ester carboxylesterase
VTTQRVELERVVLAVRRRTCPEPSRPTVLLLHGTGATAQDWDTVAAPLSQDREVLAVDLRGHGLSDWPGDYSLQLFTEDVVGLLERLDPAPVDLIGHSLGGLVALASAAQRPGTVRRLVLEDVGVPHPRAPETPARPDGDLAFDWRVVEQVRPEIDTPSSRWADLAVTIGCRTLVIGGGPSSFVPEADVAELADLLPAGRLTTIDAGHLVHETRPVEFLERVVAFLGEA